MFDKRKEKFVKEIQPQVGNMPFHTGLLRSYDYYHTDLCLPNMDTVAACNNYCFILDKSHLLVHWSIDQYHNSLMKFLISLLNTAVWF